MTARRRASTCRTLLPTLLLLAVSIAGCTGGRPAGPRVIVLGVDGMDPDLLQKLMDAGQMENFSRLARSGGFRRLGTSHPPQSPVAWSNFITGMNPGGHGVFDFLRHDHRSFDVAESTVLAHEPVRLFGLPLWGGGMENLRRGKAFWEYLGEAGVEATVFRVPSNFPPLGDGARTFSGMGTPDLRGTNGTFTFFTSRPPSNAGKFTGGAVVPVVVEEHAVRTFLTGPPDGLDRAVGSRAPLDVFMDPGRPLARIEVPGERIILKEGEWSDWVRVPFDLSAGTDVSGIVRFYLKEVRPTFQLYASPINIDPGAPALPLSNPEQGVEDLCSTVGRFYTQGMAEDTKALQWGVLDDEEFLDQAWSVLKENERLLEHELRRFRDRGGFLFFYFSSVDQCSHVLWRTQDPDHPAYRKDYPERVRNSLTDVYREMDRILGRVLDALGEDDTLMVISDHGFAPFYRAVHLNNWLADEGFLSLYGADGREGLRVAEDVDWARTRAYAMGFNGVFLNLFGREPNGQVTEEERSSVLDAIGRRLLEWKDPASGRRVVASVHRPEDIYSGPCVRHAPDLVVGYARGYRASWDTPIGIFGPAALVDNLDVWSGDHLMAAEEVPGILLANRPLGIEKPALTDIPVTILDLFGLERPAEMKGSSVFVERERESSD